MNQIITKSQLRITGMTCADCADKLAVRLRNLSGVSAAVVNLTAAKVTVEHTVPLEIIIREIKSAGYGINEEKNNTDYITTTFRLTGLDCADCAAKLERIVAVSPGVKSAIVNFGAAKLTAAHQIAINDIINIVEKAGYGAIPDNITTPAISKKLSFLRTHLRGVTTAISGILLITAWVISRLNISEFISIPIYLMAIIIGVFWTMQRALSSIKARIMDMNVLMMVAVIGAVCINEWDEAASVAFLFSLSNLLESYTLEKTRHSIRRLMDLSPADALVRRNNIEITIPVDKLILDDVVIVKSGYKIPADGQVLTGASAVDQSAITGESVPVEKQAGDYVYAGTLNTLGALEILVKKLSNDSSLSHIIHLVEEAQAQKAPSQTFVDNFARYYTPIVLIIAVIIAIIPPLILQQPWTPWLYRSLAMLVVSCPCALVISTPVAIVSAIGNAAWHGILIKGGAFLEQAGNLSVIAFDKTGTLTQGRPDVTDIMPIGDIDADTVLRMAASVEQRASHPLADAIIRQAQHSNIILSAINNFVALPGQGASATIDKNTIYVGSSTLFEKNGISLKEIRNDMHRLQSEGKTLMIVGTKTVIYGIIAAIDKVRPESAEMITQLHKVGIVKTVMLTGDNVETAQALSKQIGVDEYQANLMPEQKVTAVKDLRSRYGSVAMVGDGINDAPALATANIGIAMGSAGTDTALETADIVLMSDDLSKLAYLIKLSRKALKIIKENIAFSLIIKIIALLLIFPGWLTLWMAVVADMGSSIIVTLNGLRLVNGVKKK
ncbi:MAG: heavy metal translocating P-type ATPase [bacterium]